MDNVRYPIESSRETFGQIFIIYRPMLHENQIKKGTNQ